MEKNRLNTRFHRDYRQITKSKLFYQIKIFLPKKFNAVENIFSPQIPEMNYKDGTLSWNDTSKNISYSILQNGKTLKECSDTSLKIDSSNYGDYQIIAVANNHTESVASEPLAVYPSANQQIVQIRNGQGFVQGAIQCSVCPKQPAKYRRKKFISSSFADRIPSARTADDSSTNADFYFVCLTCAKPLVSGRVLF